MDFYIQRALASPAVQTVADNKKQIALLSLGAIALGGIAYSLSRKHKKCAPVQQKKPTSTSGASQMTPFKSKSNTEKCSKRIVKQVAKRSEPEKPPIKPGNRVLTASMQRKQQVQEDVKQIIQQTEENSDKLFFQLYNDVIGVNTSRFKF